MKKLIHSIPKVLIKSNAILGEGPIWNHIRNELTFVDILGKKVFFYKNQKTTIFKFGRILSSFLPSRKDGEWIALSKHNILKVKIVKKNMIKKKILKINQNKDNRLNDAAIDINGKLWLSTMNEKERVNSGKLFCLSQDFAIKKKFENFIIGNGIDWSPNKKYLYFVATDKKRIFKFNYQKKSCKLKKKKIFAEIPNKRGKPDGLCVDIDGFVWVACWDGGCVIRFSPSGKIDSIIELPISRPTSVCFGGKKMNKLFVTSAKKFDKFKNVEKNSGNVFIINTNTKGTYTNFFN